MKIKASFVALFVFCVSLALAFEKTERLSLPADGIDILSIDCGAGALHVQGEESLARIEVEAEIIVKGKSERVAEEYIKRNVRLELRKEGRKAVLLSAFKSAFSRISFRQRVINLTVKLPKNMDLDVEDGSGEVMIFHIDGNIRADDGSGKISILDIQGDVDIDDGSGTIEVRDVSGSVAIDDGSGMIRVENIGENVKVSDGSGSILIDGVGGDVLIKDDGSGSLTIHYVKGKIIK